MPAVVAAVVATASPPLSAPLDMLLVRKCAQRQPADSIEIGTGALVSNCRWLWYRGVCDLRACE